MNRLAISLAAVVAALASASTTYAADLTVDTPTTPGILVAAGNWDGGFVGVFDGHAAGNLSSPGDFDISGWAVGVSAGVNFTLSDGIVAGVVGDLAWSKITDDDLMPPGSFDVNWTGSLRGRVGLDAGAFMPYLTAGLAFADATMTASDSMTAGTNMHIGWTVGLGVEYMATDQLSVDLGYRYSDYGPKAYGTSDIDWDFATHQVSAGLNWHF